MIDPTGESGTIDPVVLAVVAAAADQVWPRQVTISTEAPAGPPAWRFSGRWWARPESTRRDRPWAGG